MSDRQWMDAQYDKYMAGQPTPQHCGQPGEPIGDNQYECAKDDAVFGLDYETGDVGWTKR